MALGASTFTAAGSAVNDLFGYFGEKAKAAGARSEASEYDLAAGLARQNSAFTKTSTEIKIEQEQRNIDKTIGTQQAGVSAGGFEQSGSALDILRDSARQGALTKAVLEQQGQITEAGYDEQAKSYDIMSSAATDAAKAYDFAAIGKLITGGLNLAGAAFSAFAPTPAPGA